MNVPICIKFTGRFQQNCSTFLHLLWRSQSLLSSDNTRHVPDPAQVEEPPRPNCRRKRHDGFGHNVDRPRSLQCNDANKRRIITRGTL
jgi:hypothetical protein